MMDRATPFGLGSLSPALSSSALADEVLVFFSTTAVSLDIGQRRFLNMLVGHTLPATLVMSA
jgi:hypothetical protein